MTVKELKEQLEDYDENMEVVEFMGEPIEKVTLWCNADDKAFVQIY